MSGRDPITRRTRRELLAAAGAAAGAGALVPATARAASTSTGAATTAAEPEIPVPERLARLMRLELLMLYCYDQILAGSILHTSTHRVVLPLRGHEVAHVAALRAHLTARGGTAPPPPAGVAQANRYLGHRHVGGRLGQLEGDQDAVYLLYSLEQVTVGAYFVALTKFDDPSLITLIAEMMANDAQHEAILSLQLPPYKIPAAVPYGLIQGVQ
jgi:hypothetical protein